MPTAYLSPSQLKELTDVSVNPEVGQSGYPLVWNNSLGKWVISLLPYSSLSGAPALGTMAAQNASAVAITGGSASGLSSLAVSGTTASTSTTTGALTVTGGVGIGGICYPQGVRIEPPVATQFPLYILGSNTTCVQLIAPNNVDDYPALGIISSGDSSNRLVFGLTNGTPFFGLGPGNASRDIFVRRQSASTLRIAGNSAGSSAGNLEVTGQIRATASTASTSTTTGALTVTGGVGIGGNLHVGGTQVNFSNLPTSDASINVGDLWRDGNVIKVKI